ncbi:LPXTG-domain-containing cell wall anchor domain-containing protein, putative [Babesia ovata]|uniref:LPXTG-domain-containing cell wall anchor domain-containing protein, putative n=1 Tax=Babesia ovata TaxID=189622 RepID=A0A2H6KG70_9APIC|nr:LPXTG-domain-containing cell wall anchor domain-containing protein, putative [Babesia ovata]GBE61992.1 LPXTG-domain-containing cell wall anchor domain-containing protein, putative [Babesia ovata]
MYWMALRSSAARWSQSGQCRCGSERAEPSGDNLRDIMKLIPEIVEERGKLPGGARRPPGDAVEVRAQRQQGILAAAGGSEDGEKNVASLLRYRQITVLESHVDTALAADVARVEGMSLELGVGAVSQEGLEGGRNFGTISILIILPATIRFPSRTL